VHAQIVRQLRMKRREQEPAVPHEYRLLGELAEDFDFGAERTNPRRTNEDTAKRPSVAREVDIGLEALHLAPVGVPVDLELSEAKVLTVEHDHPRAGAQDRPAILADRLIEAVETRQVHDRRRLATRDDEAVQRVEILRQANRDDIGTESLESYSVLAKRPLQSQNADPRSPLHGLSLVRNIC